MNQVRVSSFRTESVKRMLDCGLLGIAEEVARQHVNVSSMIPHKWTFWTRAMRYGGQPELNDLAKWQLLC